MGVGRIILATASWILAEQRAVPPPLHPRCRVPAVYLTHAILAIVAFCALRGMNNLRVSGSTVRSPPPLPNFLLIQRDKNARGAIRGH
jgi:hypothetical protein